MAETAYQTQYRDEFIAAFEQRQSLLRETTTTEAVIKGNTATFLVAGTGSATTRTRGANGLITARADDLTQASATLVEQHDLSRKTGFNIFAGQGDQRAIMQAGTMAVVNRRIDSEILTELLTGTIQTNSGTATTASVALIMAAKTKLGNAGVPWDSNITGVISPAFEAYLMQLKEFSSREYINGAPIEGADVAWKDKPTQYRWLGVNWIVHPNIAGVGTASESCFLYHKSAIGHAINVAGISSLVGYDEEQDYSWARCSAYMGPKLLQNTGVVEMVHDGSAYA
jgi:hypothetical protein